MMEGALAPPEPDAVPGGTSAGIASDQRALRRHNLSRVLTELARCGPRSRARLADTLALNKTTVSKLVRELLRLELVGWAGEADVGGPGRPSRAVRASGRRFAGVGLKLGPRSAAARVVDLAGTTRYHAVRAMDNRGDDPAAAMARLAELAAQALAAAREDGLVAAGVTIAVPGLVRGDSGVMLAAPVLGWTSVPVGRELSARLGPGAPPVHVATEAAAGAIGELWRGAGREFGSFVYVSGEGTVEAGVVIDGVPFSGADGFGGELGHLRVDPDGRPCPCGSRGCLETVVGPEALARLAGDAGADPHEVATGLAALAAGGDEAARETVAELGRWLGVGLSSLSNLFNPEAIVLGGNLAILLPGLLESAAAEIRCRVFSARWSRPALVAEQPGSDPVGHGAALRALHGLLNDPTGTVAALTG
jgi:predicted NBD/HSP70 family sugar kinase